MTTPLHRRPRPHPGDARDAATREDQVVLARKRTAAAQRALGSITSGPGQSTAPAELARIVIEASSLNVDVDHVGEELHVLDDRVDLVDRTGRPIRSLARDRLTAIKIRKRLKTATLIIRSADADAITMKGVDPADAESVRDELLGLTQAPTRASAALQHLDELAAAGLLDEKDLAAKRARLFRHGPAR